MTQWAPHPVQQLGRSVERVIRPTSVGAALAALHDHPSAHPVAGGTDLLLDLHRGGPGEAVTLVDLTTVPELRGITIDDQVVSIGATATHNEIVAHPGLTVAALPLAQACIEIGSPQLRNRATVAGNLATASPANDTISALLALDASITIAGLAGSDLVERVVPLDDFFTGFRSTVLGPGELITRINFPALTSDDEALWVKLGNRRAQAISVVHLAIVLRRESDESIKVARLAIGSVAERVVLLPDAASALAGTMLDDDAIAAAGAAAGAAVTPIDDVRATGEYRSAMIPTLVGRALRAIRDGHAASQWPANPPCLSASKAAPPPGARDIDDTTEISVTLNGVPRRGTGAASATLLDWIRDECGLPGTKEGCAEGECGACTVRLDGQAVMSCLVPAAQADGGDIVTIEGIGDPDQPHPIQSAFVDEFAVQCGFCIPGFIVAGATLLDEIDDPDDDQIRLGLSGNLCRCTGYYPIIQAVRTAAWAASSDDRSQR